MIALLLITICLFSVWSQPVIVSEYYNDNFTHEWTEILVVQDNLDLRGWIVTDNNATQTTRQGGVRFRNIPQWQHVRAGTIIGIWHRDYISNTVQDFDTSLADGRVMLAKNDTRFFDPYASPDVQFPDAPMNLAQEGDIMQILDANGNHVHGLGHRSTPGSYWLAMPEPKLNTANALNNGQSNRVFPGSTLTQYNGHHGAPLSEGCAQNITRTLPNRSCTSSASNWEFWHINRRPQWDSPSLNVQVNVNTVHLSWSPASDPYRHDGLQGYLVVRDSSLQGFMPEQGRIYRTGERIGSAIILALLPSTTTSFIDQVTLHCGLSYTYRVFAYRFAQDDEYGPLPPPQSTRGRQYNVSSFASSTALKIVEAGPKLQTDGPTTFCDGAEVILRPQNFNTTYSAQWLLNGAVIPGATNATFRAQKSGEYRLRLQRPDGCFVLSDSVVVTVRPVPTALVQPSHRVTLCADSSIILTAQHEHRWRYQWFRDGSAITGATQSSYLVTASGSYTVVILNEYDCSTQSLPTIVDRIDVRLIPSANSVSFPTLSGCKFSVDTTIAVTNNSNLPLNITKVYEPTNFRIVSPSTPFDIKPGQTISITIRFAPNDAGTWRDSIGFQLNVCSKIQWVYVMGVKSGTTVSLRTDSTLKSFGTLKRCDGVITPYQDSIIVHASGDLTIEAITVSTPWRLPPAIPLPIILRAGDAFSIPITFAPTLDRSYNGDLAILYTSAQCSDSLKLSLRGTLTTPYIALSERTITFPPLDSCTNTFVDTTIVLYNVSLAPIDIPQLTEDGIEIVEPLPRPTITIPPQDSFRVRLRYSPRGYTTSMQQLNIQFGGDRCVQSELLIVKGMRIGTAIALNRKNIHLGPILLCRDTVDIIQPFTLDVDIMPEGATVVEIVSVSTSAQWLSTNLYPGILQKGLHSYLLKIHTGLVPRGTSFATMSIRSEPCNRILKLDVDIDVDDLQVGFVESSNRNLVHVDFGSVPLGRQAQQRVTIHNLSNWNVTFSTVISPQPPPYIFIDPTILTTLASKATMSIPIVFAPIVEGYVNDTFTISVNTPCVRTLMIVVTGVGIRDTSQSSQQSLTLAVPETHTVLPGDRIQFTIECRGINTPIRIDSMIVPLKYNRNLFHIDNITPGSVLTSGSVGGNHSAHGYTCEFRSIEIPRSGTIAVLEGVVLLGDQRETTILPMQDYITVSNPAVVVTRSIPGVLKLSDKCNLDSRLVNLGSSPMLTIYDAGDNLFCALVQPTTSHTRILFFDISGRLLLRVFDGLLSRGTHTFTIPKSSLPASTLVALYATEHFTQTSLLLNQ